MEPTGPLPTDPDLSYIAGFVDGEGCFTWKQGDKPGQGSPRLCITNTYSAVLHMIQRRFGGRVRDRGIPNVRSRRVFEWYVYGVKARAAIRALLPFLHEKAEQARLLLVVSERAPQDRAAIIRHITDLKKNPSKPCPNF